MTNESLTEVEVVSILTEWAAHQTALHGPLETFTTLTGSAYDSPLLDPISRVWDAYSKLVSDRIGDDSGWLGYYEYECAMGAKPKEVSWKNPDGSREVVIVDSLEKLAYVIVK